MASRSDVGRSIREDLVAGAWAFGARITIDELASRYGVSHMPVREALHELAGEGLITLEPNRGARVRTLDADFVENLFDIRNALEAMLARRAALRCTKADVEQLQSVEAALERAIAEGDFAQVPVENRAFHRIIYQAAGNPDALSLVDRHWMLVTALWRHHGFGRDRFSDVPSDHRHIVRALATHDVEAAGLIMGAHVTKAKQKLLARMSAPAEDGEAAA